MSLYSGSSHMAGDGPKLVNPSEAEIWRPLSNYNQIVLHDPSQPWLQQHREKINPVLQTHPDTATHSAASPESQVYFSHGVFQYSSLSACVMLENGLSTIKLYLALLLIFYKTPVTTQESWIKFFQHSNAAAWMLKLVVEYLCRNS